MKVNILLFVFLSAAMEEVNNLDREIQRFRKSNDEKQEKNEKLSLDLQMAQNECENLKKKIQKKKTDEEALLAQYKSNESSLKEAENTLLRLKKVVPQHHRCSHFDWSSSVRDNSNSPNGLIHDSRKPALHRRN